MISLAKGINAVQNFAGGSMRLPIKNLTLLWLFLNCYRDRLPNGFVLKFG